MIHYKDNVNIDTSALISLYRSVGWTAYLSKPDKMSKILAGSLFYRSAWDGEKLIGLVRVIGDDASIIYIQDLLVAPSHHGRGVGKALLSYVLEKYAHIRQIVLLTGKDDGTEGFYRSLSLVSAEEEKCISFVKFNTNG